jgi:hypothetical protein
MARQYKNIRVSYDTWTHLENMRQKMEKDIHQRTGKRIPMKMIRIVEIVSNPRLRSAIYVDKDDIYNISRRRKRNGQ